jgi:ATP-dependent helicase/nuclease subunit A
MKRSLQVSPDTKRQQALATEPDRFVWVSANAGSGKTTVLVRRMLRLMLEGVAPSRILCLTFTEAAAANMKNRLFEKLSQWAIEPEDALITSICATTGAGTATPQQRSIARTLFALALQSPGGLKISTIHGFCTSVLQIAPIEANVPARFQVADDALAKALLREARDTVLSGAADDGDGTSLLHAINRITHDVNSDQFDQLLGTMLDRSELFMDRDGDLISNPDFRQRLATALAVPADVTPEAVSQDALGALPSHTQILIWIDVLRNSTKNDQNQAIRLQKVLDTPDIIAELEAWSDVVLTGKGGARKDMVTAPIAKAHPHLNATLSDAVIVVKAQIDLLRSAQALERTAALYAVIRLIRDAYHEAKARRRILDYSDLIFRTRNLLARVSPSWVLYKLDANIDHLLVDEAQDTNPAQWAILDALTDEFTAGTGTRNQDAPPRTVFSVGDEKQSIFRFQGAEPSAFDQSRKRYTKRTADAEIAFESIRLEQSFRSTREIITFIDAAFGTPARWQGLSAEPEIRPQRHQTARGTDAGTVDLWPLEADDPKQERQAWDEPVDAPSSGESKLATRIAAILKRWTQDGHDDLGQPFEPGHVLILLRTRKKLFEAIIRALKQAGVPVAGTDRLTVQTHIAAQDMAAIGRAALLPGDDLTLAAMLKTPVFGLDDDALLRFAPERPGSLAQALAASTDPVVAGAAQLFADIRRQALRLGPFGFYAWLLGPMGGRKAMVARLGSEANDILDVWLSAALDYETQATPSLGEFLRHSEASEQTIKRDMAVAMGEVRVMTVHGAKGLEAPIVIIPDIGVFNPEKPARTICDIEIPAADGTVTGVPIWVPRKDLNCERFLAAKAADAARDREERHRLLYVALSRAENRLILAGATRDGTAPQGSWRAALEETFAELAEHSGHVREVSLHYDAAHADSKFQRYQIDPPAPVPQGEIMKAVEQYSEPLPDWLIRPAPVAEPQLPPITPSSALSSADMPERPSDGDYQPEAAQRGQLAHFLLQHLPEVPRADQPVTALRLARLRQGSLPDHIVAELVDDILELLGDFSFHALFGPSSLAEVEIAGQLVQASGSARAVQGRIDRLAILEDRIIVADYKTARRVPVSSAAIPMEQLTQMAVYCALLSKIMPEKPINAMLIYTSGPAVFTLEPARLEAALALVGTLSPRSA